MRDRRWSMGGTVARASIDLLMPASTHALHALNRSGYSGQAHKAAPTGPAKTAVDSRSTSRGVITRRRVGPLISPLMRSINICAAASPSARTDWPTVDSAG